MRHAIAGYKLGRDGEDRRALRRNLATALLTHGQTTTTLPKAKSVQPLVERMITFAKKGTLAARRHVMAELGDRIVVPFDLTTKSRKELANEGFKVNKYHELQDGPRLVKRLFEEVAPKFSDRAGGYTRIVKLAKHRVGDGTSLVVLMLVGKDDTGPQVSGQYSRRRDKANKRMAFSAKLRKAKADKPAEAAPAAKAE